MVPKVAVTGSASVVLPPDVSVTFVPALIDFVESMFVAASNVTLPPVAVMMSSVAMLELVDVSVISLAADVLPETRIAPVAR